MQGEKGKGSIVSRDKHLGRMPDSFGFGSWQSIQELDEAPHVCVKVLPDILFMISDNGLGGRWEVVPGLNLTPV